MKDRTVKQAFFWDGQWEMGGHKERGNKGECGGCILYPHGKIEECNLLKLF
jgi:hypothetical protein